ncbi:MAG TPA: hypothetical protein VM686_03875 [Polyangiaceae bacterium]|nr:hypothetical protein [Polyangiaceae bacterium]
MTRSTEDLARRTVPGPVLELTLTCLACLRPSLAEVRGDAPELLRCPHCGQRRAVRDEDWEGPDTANWVPC